MAPARSPRSRFQLHRVWLVATGTGKYGRTPASDDETIKLNVDVFSDRSAHYFTASVGSLCTALRPLGLALEVAFPP